MKKVLTILTTLACTANLSAQTPLAGATQGDKSPRSAVTFCRNLRPKLLSFSRLQIKQHY